MDQTTVTKTHHRQVLTWGIIFVAANMRLPITMMPSLMAALQKEIGLPSSLAGLVTTIPLFVFAVMSPVIAWVARRFGNERTIYALLILVAIGSYLRILPTIAWLFSGTLILAIGIDGGNVLLPAIIKDRFADKLALTTSQYTVSMLLVGALGTGISGLLVSQLAVAPTMALLSIISLINLIIWLPNLKQPQTDQTDQTDRQVTTALKSTDTTHASVWKTPLAWVVTAFFGLQALVYYALLTWLPTILMQHGFSDVNASNLVTVMQLANLPMAFIAPLISERRHGVSSLLTIIGIGFIGGTAGFMLPGTGLTLNYLFAILLGLGAGAAFNLAIVFFTQKTTTGAETADLSGMAQSAGYLLAAIGPVLFGMLGQTVGWQIVLLIAILLAILLLVTGLISYHHATIYR
ncbi:MFS transporter [Lapidilactobacillus wuchangensis]|uniref:MFS transporter n=1 Tax=Lapidilactobacillus wuchangensis TaxID=2486001 RepID=UPI000F79250C|nr:MFS transporter [Lapidilactobacillus wuchangensis]